MGAPVVHFEIGCRDQQKTAAFYSSLLGWSTEQFGPAAMINTGEKSGIMGHFTALGHEPHNYCLVYAQVEDLDPYLKRASELGGSVLIPPTEVPGMGHFAWIKDPEGTVFGLWKAAMP